MFREDLCTKCGECLSWCPYMDLERAEAVEEFKKVMEGKPSQVVSDCVSCMGCDEICPEKANPFSLFVQRQEGQREFDRFAEPKKRMEGAYSLPSEIQKGNDGGPVIDLCTVSPMIPGLVEGDLFEGATFLKGGDYYCGIGFYHIGLSSPVEKNARALVGRVAALGAKEIVCYHDDCYSFFKVKAPEFGIDVPFRPVSWLEFLSNRLKELGDRVRPLNRAVAYQRPCASRYTPEKDFYADEIFRLAGVSKPSRTYEGVNSLCCGGALVPRSWEQADRFKHKNLADAKAAGAEIMVTLCPMCYANLRKRAPEHGLVAMPISDLCRAAVGEIEIPAP